MWINFKYNDSVIILDDLENLNNLLLREELLQLPLLGWKELIILKSGTCGVPELRLILIAKINAYDNSEAVNGFYYKDNLYWLDKNTRMGLMNLANCSDEPLDLVLSDQVLTMSPEMVKGLLKSLEVYAGKCYSNTAKHLLAVKNMYSADELLNYDYTLGYPEKLTLQ